MTKNFKIKSFWFILSPSPLMHQNATQPRNFLLQTNPSVSNVVTCTVKPLAIISYFINAENATVSKMRTLQKVTIMHFPLRPTKIINTWTISYFNTCMQIAFIKRNLQLANV
jgi:hypothetical protein